MSVFQIKPSTPEIVLKIEDGDNPVFEVCHEDQLVKTKGNLMVTKNTVMNGDLTIEGGLSVNGEVTIKGDKSIVVNKKALEEQSIEEMLTGENESLRAFTKIMMDKILGESRSIDETK